MIATDAYREYDLKLQKMIWDPKTIDIQTKSVEKALQPLVIQVTTLVNHGKKNKGFKKGRKNKKASQLLAEIEIATTRLVEVANGIASDFPEIEKPMLEACKETSSAGDAMKLAASEFLQDPCTPARQNGMVRTSRSLLTCVTRLLCIADMADVFRLLSTLREVESRLKELETIRTSDALLSTFKHYGNDLMKLAKSSGIREADMRDIRRKDEMASARETLKTSSRMLLTSSQVYINHPDLQSAQKNRDYVITRVNGAISAIAGVAQASGKNEKHPYEEVGYLTRALEELSAQLDREPEDLHDENTRNDIQTLVEDIASGASHVADSVCTRESTRENIYTECHHVQMAVNGLLSEFDGHNANSGPEVIESAKQTVETKTKDLTKQLDKSVVEHVSDSFLETNVPLTMLAEAAQLGNRRQVEDCSNMFLAHSEKLQKVADLACSMSGNTTGIKEVKMAAKQLSALSPQVVNAANVLADRPNSKPARDNLKEFLDAWSYQVEILTATVDDITTIDDFLSATESHVLEDINHCLEALKDNDAETLDRIAGAVRGRIARVEHVVMTEMRDCEQEEHVIDAVEKVINTMKNTILPEFAEYIDISVAALSQHHPEDIDEEMFLDISRLVHDGMRDIRKAVAMRDPSSESDDDNTDEDFHPEDSLLSQISNEKAKQREQLAYEQLAACGKVQFEVHSECLDDPGCRGLASIMVNGVEYCPRKRGHNVVVLDQCGSVVKSENFDTTQHRESEAMAHFLNEIPKDHIALVAVQETTGDAVNLASDALQLLGASVPIDPGFSSSWAFAGYKGDHNNKEWVSQVTRPRYQGPSMISDMINTPAADMGKIRIEISSEGSEDDSYTRTASVRINNIERSPMGRGMNVVVLDDAGHFLLSKNFDTADPQHAVGEGKRMAKFLDDLPTERIVAIASLEDVGDGLYQAKDALIRIGAKEPFNTGNQGSFALIGYTGPGTVTWLQQVCKQPKQGPSKISVFILTPAAVEDIQQESTEANDDDEGSISSLNDEQDKQENVQQSARSLMRALPQSEKLEINKLNERLILEKNRLISEVSKWDEQGNEIIILAKRMCMIMMDMSDFTRGFGPLKTTVDVIRAAEKIGKCGSQLNRLAGEIAEMCSHSHTRSDLLAYLQRVALYSHQLTITAKVKSAVQVIGGEVIISEVESAKSLIQSAKNLMNSVILAVKASYIASTKHRTEGDGIVSWHMVTPKKKSLFDDPDRALNSPVSSRSSVLNLNDFK